MPGTAIKAAALTDHSAHPYSLEVGSLDVIKDPGNTGMGVSLNSISVREVGPGGVSSMEFVIDDPLGAISITQPLPVFFKANDGASPETVYFRGWIDSTDNEPAFGGQGRQLTVRCSGVEQLLDWAVVPSTFQFTSATTFPRDVSILATTFQPLLQRMSEVSVLSAPWTQAGSFNNPTGNLVRAVEPIYALTNFSTWTSPGSTLRNAILDLAAHCSWFNSVSAATDFSGLKILLTVDFSYGLRMWEDDPSLQPDDYTTLVVTDNYASTTNAASLNVSTDFAAITRSAYVVGSASTDYGVTSDGSGIPGRQIFINDSSITTPSSAAARARSAMAEDSASMRGDFILGPFAPATTIHAGSLLTLVDAATGVIQTQRIMQIDKTFRGDGQQTWHVTFGGLVQPALSRFTRRLTRAYN